MSERVAGIGGVFFRSKDRARLGAWYRERLGIDVQEPGFALSRWREDRDDRLPRARPRCDARPAAPRRVGIDPKRSEEENGRFAWIADPDRDRIELWEPAEGAIAPF